MLLPQLTAEYVNKMAKSYVTDNNLIVSIMSPDKDAVKIPTEFIYFDREVPLYVLNMEIQITSGRELFQETIARAIKKEIKNK